MNHLTRAAVALAIVAGPAGAFEAEYEGNLYAARIDAAAAVAEAAVAADPADGKARFALGAAQVLGAIEGLGAGLYRLGLRNDYEVAGAALGLGNVPFLRLPVPANPDPEPATYAALREVLIRFEDDLALAEATLGSVGPEPFELTLDLSRLGFDFDGDGQMGERESFLGALRAVSRADGSDAGFPVDFDQSDAPWLQGYCHLLTALGNVPLAHDWERTFDLTFHTVFPDAGLPGSPLTDEIARVAARLQELAYVEYPERPEGMSWDDHFASPAYRRYAERTNLESALEWGGIADLVAFVHLFHWPVADAARVASIRTHLLAMIDLSRENWRRIGAETDKGREWVPNLSQTGAIPGLRVTPEAMQGWQIFLDEFEAALNGEVLVAHWRFPGRGVNLARMFEEPGPLDPVLIAQGSAVVPYLEEGERIDADRAGDILQLFGGGFLAYFLWFN